MPCSGIRVPGDDATVAQQRRFNFSLLDNVSKSLTAAGFTSTVFDPAEQDDPDYGVWNVMLDGSLSKAHVKDGFYPIEIVTPVLRADNDWAATINQLWSTLQSFYEFRQDTTCGFHIHISFEQGHFSLPQLHNAAKAVAF